MIWLISYNIILKLTLGVLSAGNFKEFLNIFNLLGLFKKIQYRQTKLIKMLNYNNNKSNFHLNSKASDKSVNGKE